MAGTMIERIARTLCIEVKLDPDKIVMKGAPGSIDRHPAWMDFRGQARTIISIMRKPTQAMVRAAPGGHGDEDWPAMIDAALDEGIADAR